MPFPAFTNRFSRWMRAQHCGACDCEGTCKLKVYALGPFSLALWCVEETSCDTKCNCYCFTRNADGFLVDNCPTNGIIAPIGTVRNGLCLKCAIASAASRHNKCGGAEVICGGFCRYYYNGTIFEEAVQGCLPLGSEPEGTCDCPPAPSGNEGTVVGEVRLVGPCVAGEEEDDEPPPMMDGGGPGGGGDSFDGNDGTFDGGGP